MAEEQAFAALRVLEGWKPLAGPSFRKGIALAYRWITSSADISDVLMGWSNLDVEFGGNAPELSVFAVLHLQTLQPTEELRDAFEPRVLMTLLEVELAVPTAVGPLGPGAGWFRTGWLYRELFPPGRHKDTTDRLKRDTEALATWLGRELSPFGGDLAKGR